MLSTLYNPRNNREIEGRHCDDSYEIVEWIYDDELRQKVPVVTGIKHFQDEVDANRGGDMVSICRRMESDNPIKEAIDKGLIVPSEGQAEDVDLTQFPQSAPELLRAVREGQSKAAALNHELGSDFSLADFANG